MSALELTGLRPGRRFPQGSTGDWHGTKFSPFSHCTDPECESGSTHEPGQRLEVNPWSLRILRRRRR